MCIKVVKHTCTLLHAERDTSTYGKGNPHTQTNKNILSHLWSKGIISCISSSSQQTTQISGKVKEDLTHTRSIHLNKIHVLTVYTPGIKQASQLIDWEVKASLSNLVLLQSLDRSIVHLLSLSKCSGVFCMVTHSKDYCVCTVLKLLEKSGKNGNLI